MDAVEVVPDAFARVPADALPVVTTTWALSCFPIESRLRFLHRLEQHPDVSIDIGDSAL